MKLFRAMDSTTKIYILLGLYVGSLYASNLLGGKLMPIGFGSRGLTVSIIMLPFLFLITDIVGEVYGRKEANRFVYVGFFSLVVLFLWQLFSIAVPGAVPTPWYNTFNEAYGVVFGLSLTFTIASLIAYITGQYIDVMVYQAMRRGNPNRLMWLRNNVSTAVGQFVDAALWTLIAFAPKISDGSFTLLTIFSIIIIPYWLSRCVLAALQTPLCYVGVWWLRCGAKPGKA